MSKDNPRIAVLGFAIECNRFSPVSTAEDFETDVDIRGNRIVSEARSGASITLPDLPGFFAEMDRTGQWTPVPLRVSQAQPGGPVEEGFFKELPRRDRGRPEGRAAARRACSSPAHGAALAEGTDDPDGDLFEVVRRVVGPDMPVVAVFDLHANVSRKHDRQSLGVRRLSREPAHRHLRARHRSRQAHARMPGRRAHRHHHGQGAAGAAADLAADRARAPTPT